MTVPADRINRQPAGMSAVGGAPGHPHADPVEAARTLLRLRRKREVALGSAFFSDPSWDMLLNLVVAEGEKRAVSVSNLCMEAMVPTSTGLRWLHALESAGHVEIRRHIVDRRTRLVTLAPDASVRLHSLLREL